MTADPTAFIAEAVAIDERGPVATGLFSGSVQTDDGGITDAIDRDLSLVEAVRWGRERADRVVVRIAGEEPCIDPALDENRTLGRRRPAGWEFLDRTSADPPILWDVIVEVEADIPAGPVRPDGTWTGYATVPHAVIQVEAAGYADALAAAAMAAADAARSAGREPVPAFTATRAFPTGAEAARGERPPRRQRHPLLTNGCRPNGGVRPRIGPGSTLATRARQSPSTAGYRRRLPAAEPPRRRNSGRCGV